MICLCLAYQLDVTQIRRVLVQSPSAMCVAFEDPWFSRNAPGAVRLAGAVIAS